MNNGRNRACNPSGATSKRSPGLLACAMVVAAGLAPQPAAGWGKQGHEIVALIAEHYLSDNDRKEVRHLLSEDASLADIANWADVVRPSRPNTAPWHYVNIPPDAKSYDRQRDCPEGKCVVEIIGRLRTTLADKSKSLDERREALKFLVHFVGDLHQPLHCGLEADRGGNSIRVNWFGARAKLHEVWDTLLIERAKLTSRQYADQLIADINETDLAEWRKGEPASWATQSFELAVQHAYRSTHGQMLRDGDTLGRAYATTNTVVVDGQLSRAGVRLAGILHAVVSTTQPE